MGTEKEIMKAPGKTKHVKSTEIVPHVLICNKSCKFLTVSKDQQGNNEM